MGYKNMQNVVDWLDGTAISLKGWDRRKRKIVPDGKAIREFKASDLALLLIIASRQHDEDEVGMGPWQGDECVCVGNENTLATLAYMKRSQFEESRAFLLANGLITYHEHEDGLLDFDDGLSRRSYDYVYRLNANVLRGIRKNATTEDVKSKQGVLAMQAGGACIASTKSTYNTPSNSMYAPADEKSENKARAEVYRDYIAQHYHFSDAQKRQIGLNGLISATKGKMPEPILNAIDKFGLYTNMERKFYIWVGDLINALKEVTKAAEGEKIPAAAEVAKMAQFSEAQKVPAATADDSDDGIFRRGWDELYKAQNLADLEAPEYQNLKEDLKAAYSETFGPLTGKNLRYYLGEFKGKLANPVDDIPKRVEAIQAALTKTQNLING